MRKFHLPICSLSCGSCSQRCSNTLKINWSCRWLEEKVFLKIMEKIFRYINFWEKFSRKFHLPSCSLSCGSCSQMCREIGSEGKSFQKTWKNIFRYIIFWRFFFPFIFAYLAAPYRAAAAPKGALTHWKSTKAGGGVGGKSIQKNMKKEMEIYYFGENFLRQFHLPSWSLSCGSCSHMCLNPLPGERRKRFPKMRKK